MPFFEFKRFLLMRCEGNLARFPSRTCISQVSQWNKLLCYVEMRWNQLLEAVRTKQSYMRSFWFTCYLSKNYQTTYIETATTRQTTNWNKPTNFTNKRPTGISLTKDGSKRTNHVLQSWQPMALRPNWQTTNNIARSSSRLHFDLESVDE